MNFRQYKKKLFHKTMKHGGWRKYKKTMKEAGLWKGSERNRKLNKIKLINVGFLTGKGR